MLAKVYLTLSNNGKDTKMLEQAKILLEDVKENSGYGLLLDRGQMSSAYAKRVQYG